MEVEEKPKKHGTSKRKRMKAVQAKIREQVKKLYILGVCVRGGGWGCLAQVDPGV